MHEKVYIDNDGYITSKESPFWNRRLTSLLNYSREKQDGIIVDDEEYLVENRIKIE